MWRLGKERASVGGERSPKTSSRLLVSTPWATGLAENWEALPQIPAGCLSPRLHQELGLWTVSVLVDSPHSFHARRFTSYSGLLLAFLGLSQGPWGNHSEGTGVPGALKARGPRFKSPSEILPSVWSERDPAGKGKTIVPRSVPASSTWPRGDRAPPSDQHHLRDGSSRHLFNSKRV